MRPRLAALAGLALLLASGAWLALRPEPTEEPATSEPAQAEAARPEPGAPDRPARLAGAQADAGASEAAQVELSGRVLDRGQPAPGAQLLLDDKPTGTQADAEGRFHLRAALPCRLGARREGRSAPPRAVEEAPKGELVLSLRAEGSLAGTVRDASTGHPVPGAEVAIEPGARKARTDAEGRFLVEGLPELERPASAHLIFTATGYAHDYEDVPVPGGQRVEISVLLEPGGPVAGRVVGKGGEGVGGVVVLARSPDDHGSYDKTTSAADGRFRFAALPRSGALLRALAEPAGYATRVQLVGVPDEAVRLELGLGGEVGGRVLDGQGQPVPQAQVKLEPQGLTLTGKAQARADAEGHYALRGLAAGRYQVSALAPGYPGSASAEVEVREEAFAPLDLTLPGGAGQAAGVVVDAKSGQPLPGARVQAEGQDDEASAVAGPDGRFALHGLEPGARVRAEAPGHGSASAEAGPELRLALEPEPAVRGRVVDGEGNPLDAFGVDGEVVRSPDGRFEVHPATSARELRVSRSGYATATVALPEGWADGLDVGDVVLRAAGAVLVRATDAQGRPVAGAAIFLTHGEARPLNKLLSEGAVQLGVTDEEGRVRAALAPGEYCFRGLHPRLAPSGREGCPHRVSESGGEFAVTLRPGAWVSGHVYRGGRPASAQMVGDLDEGLSATTDSGGAYRLGPYAPGRQRLLTADVSEGTGHADVQSATVDLAEGQEATVDFGEQGSAALEVVLTGAGAAPVLVAVLPGEGGGDPQRLASSLPAGTRFQEVTPAGGAARLRFEGLKDGAYVVAAGMREARPTFRSVTVSAGTVQRVEIGLGK